MELSITDCVLLTLNRKLNRKMTTKCLNHPNRDAIGQCAGCKIPICEVCNVSEVDGLIMCEACAMLSTFTEMTERKREIDEKRISREFEETGKRQERRTKILLTAVVLTILIAVIQIIWYLNLIKPVAEQLDPSDEYISSTMHINDAIVKYRKDNDGKVPDSLEILMGEYLPETDTWKKVLWEYSYKKLAADKYELAPPAAEDSNLPDISITDEGIRVFGMEYVPE
jgi:hypothetical protein